MKHTTQTLINVNISSPGSSLEQNFDGVPDERQHTQEDEDGDEDGADGVGDHPAKVLDEDRRDDHAHGTQSVGQDVQEHTLHDLRAPSAAMTVINDKIY